MPQQSPPSSISIADVARHAKLSIGTVSRVINRHPSVSGDMRRRVMHSSRTLGFVPKIAQRCVAVITGRHSPAMPFGYVSLLTSMVSRMLAAHRIMIELIDVEDLARAYETHLDGIIGIVFDDRLHELRAIPNVPIYTINKPLAHEGIHSVYADHYQQGLLATEHLIEHGHRDIAFLAIEPNEWGSAERRRGYEAALRRHRIEIIPSRIQYTLDLPLYDTLARWSQREVTALLNFSEDASLEVLHILSNVLGLTIGRDISTITLEDLPIYQYLSPPQTVVKQPLEAMAQLVVKSLVDNMTNPIDDTANQVMDHCVTTELVERDSVAMHTQLIENPRFVSRIS